MQVFNPLSLSLCTVLGSVLISFLYVWLSSFPSTIYWRGCLCPIVYSCLLYKNKVSIGALVYFWAFYLVPLVFRASLVAQRVKRLLAMRETWVRFLGQEDPLEKEIATHSSILAWKIPWMEKPGRLQSMGSQRVGHDWATSLSLFTFKHWRRKWQLTPVFLPGESQGRGSLMGCRLWGCTESDTTEVT